MAKLKYSRQRECIKQYLSSTKEHPSADTIFINVKQTLPAISLGTVYRNLNLLLSEGEVLRLDCGDGCERFDGNSEPHYHFICRDCHRVIDLDMDSIEHINTLASMQFDGEIHGHIAYFYGLCSECLKNKSEKQ